mgnify:FL=1
MAAADALLELVDRVTGAPDFGGVVLTREEALSLRSLVGAYAHLVGHPAGVQAALVKLRLLRKAWRELRR